MKSDKKYLFWVDGLKAFAIIGILLNHFVESIGSSPWFSTPSYNWPDLSVRMSTLFPTNGNILCRLVQFLGWLGDMGPGVFILVSGFALTLSSFKKAKKENNFDFYLKRLVRIFPLYILIHLLILLGGLVITKSSANFNSPMVLLSMLGLRFTDRLFFYINPSWWFIWLIIQLYLLFPFLFKLLERKGIQVFLFVTLGFTILSRLAGLLNFTYSNYLEYWMTGIFFGTRLFEFAAGMILAKLYFEKRFDPWSINNIKLFFVSLATYATGFVCSMFYSTTLISSVLITIGLSGLFMSFCKLIELYFTSIKKMIIWIGAASFPVFLFHQPILIRIARDFSGITRIVAMIFFLILIFPIGWLLDKAVNKMIVFLPRIKNSIILSLIMLSLTLQVLLNIVYFVSQNSSILIIDIVFFIINIFFIPLYLLLGNKITHRSINPVLSAFLPASALFLFILTNNWFSIFWIFIIILLIAVWLISLISKKLIYRISVSYTLVFVLFFSIEGWFSKNHPVEINRWGELPALQKDSLTIYSLIPNQLTHLKYNNYDYYVKTNSLGFNGPEVKLVEKAINEVRILIIGDAFTMPEGMEYEKAYPELFQAQMRVKYPSKKIVVFNAGVTGFGPNEMYVQLRKYIDTIKPDIFINQFFINEFEEINLDAKQRWNSIGLHEFTMREKLFSDCQIPEHIKSSFHKLINDEIYLKKIYNKSLAYFYDRSSSLYLEDNLGKMRKYLTNIKLLCEEKKCKFFLLYAPGQPEVSSREEISYYPSHVNLDDSIKVNMELPVSILRTLCNENQIPFLNPKEMLRENPIQPVYFKESWHWNTEGHKVIATFLNNNF